MTLLDRNALLTKQEVKIEKVELGGEDFVYVCEMTGRARDHYERSLFDYVDKPEGGVAVKRKTEDFRAKLVTNTVCDEKGRLLLRPNDWEKLSQSMGFNTLDKIADAAMKLNKLTLDDKEDLAKKLKAATDGGSSSDSVES